MTLSIRAAVLASVLTIVACGSSPPVRYFSLEAENTNAVSARPGAPLMSIGPLRFPEYLSRTQFVTRAHGNEMIVDDFTRWAEPLDQAVHRVIAADVDARVDNIVVTAFPSASRGEFRYRLVGTIVRLDVDHNREAQLSVQWAVADSDGTMIVAPRRSHFVSRAASSSPGDMVGAISDTIAQFSREIADEVGQMPGAAEP